MPIGHEVQYPRTAPTDCAMELFGYIRAGTVAENKAAAALCFWIVLGFILSMLFGNPDGPVFGSTPEESDELAAFNAAVGKINEAVASEQYGTEFTEPAEGTYGARDWKKLFDFFVKNVLPIILPLILKDSD